MIELIQEYWRPFIYSDGQQITGLAMTLWLTSASSCLGLLLALPLSIARTSSRRWLRWPVQSFTYVFRGTPLYIQLLIFYTGIYSIGAVREQPLLDAFFAKRSIAPFWRLPSIPRPTPRKYSRARSGRCRAVKSRLHGRWVSTVGSCTCT